MNGGELWTIALRLVVALIVVIPLLLITTRLYGRRFFLNQNRRALRLVEAVPLGPGRTLCLVEVGGRFLLLGVTAHQVTLLTELDKADIALMDKPKEESL